MVGIEVCGALAEIFKAEGKRIGLLTRSKTLLSVMPPKAHEIAQAALQKQGVEIYLGRTYDEAFKKEQDFEQTVNCMGL